MKITTVNNNPVAVASKEFVATFNEAEACILRAVVGSIGGGSTPEGKAMRNVTGQLWTGIAKEISYEQTEKYTTNIRTQMILE